MAFLFSFINSSGVTLVDFHLKRHVATTELRAAITILLKRSSEGHQQLASCVSSVPSKVLAKILREVMDSIIPRDQMYCVHWKMSFWSSKHYFLQVLIV